MLEAPFGKVEAKPRPLVEKPHMFIRVSKYKEVMEAIRKLRKNIDEAKDDLEELKALSNEEESKLKDTVHVVLEIESLLKYLEETFTSPQE